MSESPKKYGGYTLEQLKETQDCKYVSSIGSVARTALIEEIERLREALLEVGLHLSSFLPDTGTPDVSGAARVVRSALSDTMGEG